MSEFKIGEFVRLDFTNCSGYNFVNPPYQRGDYAQHRALMQGQSGIYSANHATPPMYPPTSRWTYVTVVVGDEPIVTTYGALRSTE